MRRFAPSVLLLTLAPPATAQFASVSARYIRLASADDP